MGQSAPLPSPVVLVVDDEFMLRLLASDILEDFGFQVVEASNASEAISVLQERNDVRLLFTDVNMPGLTDGAWLARNVRQRWPDIEIIVTSGRMDINDLRLPMGSQFMPKPYTGGDLMKMVCGLRL